MDRESRIVLFQIICFILMFSGLALFFAVNTKAFITEAPLPVSYAIIAISGFASASSVLVAEKVLPVMIATFVLGCGLIIFGFFHLVPH